MKSIITCGLCITFAFMAASCSISAEEAKPASSNFLLPDLQPGETVVEVSPTPPDRWDYTKKDLADLSSTDTIVRGAAQDRLQYLRSLIISELIGIVKDKTPGQPHDGAVYRAARLLESYRAKEAINVLAERITFFIPEDEFDLHKRYEYEEYYPCAAALVSIGEPSVDLMISKISLPENELERELATWVVVKIEGKENAASRFDRLMKDSKDDRQRTNYQWAKDYATSYKPKFGIPYLSDQRDGA